MAYAGGCKKGATILLTNWICQWSWHFPISCSLSVLVGSDPSSFFINERERDNEEKRLNFWEGGHDRLGEKTSH